MRGAYDTEFARFASGKPPSVSPARDGRALTFCRPRTISETRDEGPPSGAYHEWNIAMRRKRKPLRRVDDLLAAGLISPERRAGIEAVAARYALALTGGDPLVLSARRLKELVAALAAIAHVKVIRVHSRVPVAEPSRVTAALARALRASGKATYVVLHANHARELTPAARAACARLVDAGIPMLSQSVLLRGINDDAAALGELMRALVECRIKPYYLHHGDLAPGTAHWGTSIEEGQSLMRALRGRLSGLCQPTYVLDIPGGHGKAPIGPSYLARVGGSNGTTRYEIEDFNGCRHVYPPAG